MKSKFNSTLSCLYVSIIILVGCKSVSFIEIYPHYYTKAQYQGHRVTIDQTVLIHKDYHTLPMEIFNSLPPDIAIAALTDHIAFLQDTAGLIKFNKYSEKKIEPNVYIMNSLSTGKVSKTKYSQRYEQLRKEYSNSGFIEYAIPGYPHITSFVENIDYDSILAYQYATSWESWIEEYSENDSIKNAKIELGKTLLENLNNLQNISNEIDRQIQKTKEETKENERLAKIYLDEYNRLRQQGFTAEKFWNKVLVNEKYDFDKDPFKEYYEKKLVPVSPERYAMNKDVHNKHLHTETLNAYDKVLDIFKSPEKYFEASIAQKIGQLDKPVIASLSRSIVHQATMRNSSAAGWLSSTHALGGSIDMQIGKKNYDVSMDNPPTTNLDNYKLFELVMETGGFTRTKVFSDKNERNHFTLTSIASHKNGEKVTDPDGSIYRKKMEWTHDAYTDFVEIADRKGTDLNREIAEAVKNNDETIKKIGNAHETIKQKHKSLDEEKTKLEDAMQKRKQNKKLRDKEEERIRRNRGNPRCKLLEFYEHDHEFHMNTYHNTIKHHDCNPRGRDRC